MPTWLSSWKKRLKNKGFMFQVSVEETFSAGHALRGYRGKCENVHGHNYRVRVSVEGPQLDRDDFVGLRLVSLYEFDAELFFRWRIRRG